MIILGYLAEVCYNQGMILSPHPTQKFCHAALLALCALFALRPISALAEPRIERTIEIDFDAVPNATKYEVKVSPFSDLSIPPLTFLLDGVHFSKKIPLGHWKVEVRTFDKRRVAGRWNSLGDVEIKFKAPVLLNPTEKATLNTEPDIKTPVIFKWETFSPLASYNLVIKSNNSPEALLETKVVGGTFTHPLAQGSYTWTLTSIPPKGIALDGVDPKEASFDILAGRLASPIYEKPGKLIPISFSWQPVPHATSYLVVLQKMTGEDFKPLDSPETMLSKTTKTSTETMPADLKPGAYKISITAKAIGFTDSKTSLRNFKVQAPKPVELSSSKKEVVAPPQKIVRPLHVPVDFLQGSMGPVFWTYSFKGNDGHHFNLVAATVTAISADVNKWFAVTAKSAWAAEVRGRQTNIYLFEQPDPSIPQQSKIIVADRRIALVGRRRKIVDRVGIDAIFGLGTHHYTYLLQDSETSAITPEGGNLYEFYVGGAADWEAPSGRHASFDLVFHPVGFSSGISAVTTLQYTATLRLLQPVLHEKSYLSLVFENIRSRVQTSGYTESISGETTSTWYRFGVGLAIKL